MLTRNGQQARGVHFATSSQAQEVRADFAQTLRDVRQGVFLVGGPNIGTGTAWVISRKHRLLATNAHVADFFVKRKPGEKMLAMMNGTDQCYVVERVWYHPGVSRFVTRDENLSIRASNPKFGEVDPAGPDVAVLQLSFDGPDLPVELNLADPTVVFDLQALPAAMLGFPGHDTASWPRAGRAAQATFHPGVVSRVSDFQFEGGIRPELAQMLQYTMETYSGFSGAPVFLCNGSVIGLHNSARPIDKTRMVAHGVRIDVLCELLAHHKLDAYVPMPFAGDRLFIQRWLEPDPNLEKFEHLKKLVDEADYLIYTRLEFAAGIDKCNEALALYPKYAPAYRVRCDGFNNWYFRSGDSWGVEKRLKFLQLALADAEKNIELHKSKVARDAFLARIVVLNNLGYVSKLEKYNMAALDVVSKILSDKDLPTSELASALSYKAVALSNLERTEESRAMHSRALQINPDSPVIWENRASFMENNNSEAQAKADRAMARALRKKLTLLKETEGRDLKVISRVAENLTSRDPADARGCFRQVWTVDVEEGYFYQIDLKNPNFSTDKNYDPVLRLADENNRILAEDDDGGGYPHARIFFTAPRTTTYSLQVSSAQPGQTGSYVLTVTRIARE
jgi:tetratricopeptide (TPR) repeat protein